MSIPSKHLFALILFLFDELLRIAASGNATCNYITIQTVIIEIEWLYFAVTILLPHNNSFWPRGQELYFSYQPCALLS
jgi:hypothetical protein